MTAGILDEARYWMPDARCRMQMADARCGMPDAGCRMQDAKTFGV